MICLSTGAKAYTQTHSSLTHSQTPTPRHTNINVHGGWSVSYQQRGSLCWWLRRGWHWVWWPTGMAFQYSTCSQSFSRTSWCHLVRAHRSQWKVHPGVALWSGSNVSPDEGTRHHPSASLYGDLGPGKVHHCRGVLQWKHSQCTCS